MPSSGKVDVDGLVQFISAVNAIPDKIKRLSQETGARNVGTVTGKARKIFQDSTRRDSEHGEGEGGRRETGNFTFGKGNTFVGNTFQMKGKQGFGFGFPDVGRADDKTNRVWRSLEHGLKGRYHGPVSLGLANEFPLGRHKLPKRYMFDDPIPQRAVMLVGKGRERTAAERKGGGIEGKHFIEQAWISSLELMTGRYKGVLRDAMASFR